MAEVDDKSMGGGVRFKTDIDIEKEKLALKERALAGQNQILVTTGIETLIGPSFHARIALEAVKVMLEVLPVISQPDIYCGEAHYLFHDREFSTLPQYLKDRATGIEWLEPVDEEGYFDKSIAHKKFARTKSHINKLVVRTSIEYLQRLLGELYGNMQALKNSLDDTSHVIPISVYNTFFNSFKSAKALLADFRDDLEEFQQRPEFGWRMRNQRVKFISEKGEEELVGVIMLPKLLVDKHLGRIVLQFDDILPSFEFYFPHLLRAQATMEVLRQERAGTVPPEEMKDERDDIRVRRRPPRDEEYEIYDDRKPTGPPPERGLDGRPSDDDIRRYYDDK